MLRIRRRWRLGALAATVVVLSPFALFGLLVAWMMFPNIGLPFGYYGELNRALATLRAAPGVVVTDYRANYDLTLEEFYMDVRVADQWMVRLSVPDTTDFDNVRCVVIESWDGVYLRPVGYYPEWPGLAFSLGPGGDLEAILGKTPTSVSDAVASIDRIAAYIASVPRDELRTRHEPADIPPGSVMLTIIKAP